MSSAGHYMDLSGNNPYGFLDDAAIQAQVEMRELSQDLLKILNMTNSETDPNLQTAIKHLFVKYKFLEG